MAVRVPMTLLLDSCALIALASESLPEKAFAALESGTEACVSSVSIWEVAIKAKSGNLTLPKPPDQWFAEILKDHDLVEIPLRSDLACCAANLPMIHRDPFDRVLIATALLRNCVILTSDKTIATYPGIQTLW